ncbi:hypothetical protein PPSQR21_038520 [Paenibacillus polymyxa SQR-21]|uniref:hypothetical protein n=1 Tax=Paenibacillus TaxID=44249 RepID=UPI00042E59D7|nr:hypothetical protein [Paenibacillus polymyxa]AHM67490.1 hypothetical protein PPSQR21_038520 [Paenibacillus polymyxa SQR-21]
MKKHKAIFGIAELAILLQVSQQTIYYRMKHGKKRNGTDIPEPMYKTLVTSLWTYEQIEERVSTASPDSPWYKAKERLQIFQGVE